MEAYMKLLGTKNQSKKYLFVLNLIAVLKKLPRFWNYCDIMSYYSSPTNKFSHHLLCMSDFWILWNIQNSMGSKNTILDPADFHCMEKNKNKTTFFEISKFCVPQKEVSHTGLQWRKLWTIFKFKCNVPNKSHTPY